MVILRSFFNAIFLLVGLTLSAQSPADSVAKEKIDWKPSMIRIGYDLGSAALTLSTPSHFRQEVMTEIDFGNWFFVGELGRQSTIRGKDYSYQSEGNYWRVGFDKNLTPKLSGGHVVSAGFRFARTSFDDALDYETYSVSNQSLTAGWVEFTTGIRMKIWRQLFLGYQLRLRGFKQLSEEEGSLQTFDIPGFGRNKRSGNTVRNGGVGFSYYIYWTIPFRDKQTPEQAPSG